MDTQTATSAPIAGIPAFVTRKQLASLLSVSEQHVDNLVKQWGIPRFNLGRRIIFAGTDVAAAMKTNGGPA